ncbi:hypothetical protein HMPREF0326_03164 [Desulfovibrio sp. 3_1_syn3]|uniref:reverse transcriptase domain-containing protein n=1 Tax=Desulfovibrio sp. 3_1_syn3 TaxID=457398 RepID=UPI0002FACEA7|nr:reverse transcriptase domain-containing protein [Desulfovibrio sp. 3_1_syn3]EFL84310.2 hypothetical protein HMPREF0326_03164 [Desulfovibrio sp. 3_1_syn3]
MPRRKTLFKCAISKQSLFEAWKTVHASGSQSLNLEIRSDVENYSGELFKNLEQLQRRLSRGSFSFSPVKGVLLQKGKGKYRPIGIARIDDRIIQRSILNTLLEVNSIKNAVNNKNSFGGNKEGGVRKAIGVLNEKTRNGARFFIKTDIKNFFGSIPHSNALGSIFKLLPDDSMNELLQNAIHCELENATASNIETYIDLFPKDQIGIIQGCCLSPLLGNMLLYEFDKQQHSRHTECIRYIDDFIIIGGERQVFESFDIAIKMLSELKLNVYTLDEPDTKAERGLLQQGVNFLGCFIQPGAIRPSNKSRNNLLGGLSEKFSKSIAKMHEDKDFDVKKHSYSAVLNYTRLKVKGWADAYRFCTDKAYLTQIDRDIAKLVEEYMIATHKIIQAQRTDREKYLLLGFQSVLSKF